MIELVDTSDPDAVRNKENILAFYDLAINQRQCAEAAARYISPSYVQHNPLIPDGGEALGQFFAQVLKDRARPRVVVHRIIAVGDHVCAHVNFVGLFNDDPDDQGIAGVDIFRMDADGRAAEHWDALQLVGDPTNSAPWFAPDVPRANQNGMF